MQAKVAAVLFSVLILFAVGFQLALTAGLPWGHLAMGGRFPGRLPPSARVATAVQAIVLVVMAVVVLSRSGWGLSQPFPWAIWMVVGVSALSTVMNLITPSKAERRLWAPVGVGLLATSLVVALS